MDWSLLWTEKPGELESLVDWKAWWTGASCRMESLVDWSLLFVDLHHFLIMVEPDIFNYRLSGVTNILTV